MMPVETMSPKQALKAIAPTSVTVVMFRFEAIGGGVAFVRTAKVHARAALRALIPGAKVRFQAFDRDGTVLISGPIPKSDHVEGEDDDD